MFFYNTVLKSTQLITDNVNRGRNKSFIFLIINRPFFKVAHTQKVIFLSLGTLNYGFD